MDIQRSFYEKKMVRKIGIPMSRMDSFVETIVQAVFSTFKFSYYQSAAVEVEYHNILANQIPYDANLGRFFFYIHAKMWASIAPFQTPFYNS